MRDLTIALLGAALSDCAPLPEVVGLERDPGFTYEALSAAPLAVLGGHGRQSGSRAVHRPRAGIPGPAWFDGHALSRLAVALGGGLIWCSPAWAGQISGAKERTSSDAWNSCDPLPFNVLTMLLNGEPDPPELAEVMKKVLEDFARRLPWA